jgi:hypothetical protein
MRELFQPLHLSTGQYNSSLLHQADREVSNLPVRITPLSRNLRLGSEVDLVSFTRQTDQGISLCLL